MRCDWVFKIDATFHSSLELGGPMYVRIYLSNPALHPSETLHLNRNLRDKFKRGNGCRGATSPIKIISKSPDLQNDLLAPKNRLNASRYVSEPPSFCLHVPHFYLRLLVIFVGLMAPLHPLPQYTHIFMYFADLRWWGVQRSVSGWPSWGRITHQGHGRG